MVTLKIKLLSDRNFGDKEISEVQIPIKELLDNYKDAQAPAQPTFKAVAGEPLMAYPPGHAAGPSHGYLAFGRYPPVGAYPYPPEAGHFRPELERTEREFLEATA
uniref:Uncharacterized protein n=1 Tax=Cannabis sativa TaxID=3483 RepID=A0A803NU27_CANSA